MIPKSNEIRFEVTTKCNYDCIICPRAQLTRPLETMSYELFKRLFLRVIAETGQYDTLTFPGMGEPLLDETLDDKVRLAKEHDFTVLMLTNGYLLTSERFKELEAAGVDSIRVSMYGHSQESYNRVHGISNPKAFERVKNSLELIATMERKTKLLLTYNIVEDVNSECFKEWVAYWEPKVDLLEVWRPHNWGNAKQYRPVQQVKKATCGRPVRTPLQIQVDGTVNMCCFDFNGELLLGDLKTQSLAEIFEGAVYKKLVACHASGEYGNSGFICEYCDQRNVDTSDVMVYNSKFSIEERVGRVSTTYQQVQADEVKNF